MMLNCSNLHDYVKIVVLSILCEEELDGFL
jgi:hypothetical protein